MAATSGSAGWPAAETGTSASPELRWRQVYRGDESQIGELRRWLSGLLPQCEARDDVMTVAVELATNAVRHTASGQGGWFALEVTWYRFAVRVSVADGGAEASPHLVDDPMSECGRGLQVVHALSSRTGVAGDRRGRMVWADIPWAICDAPAINGAAANGVTALDGYESAVRDGEDILARRHADVPTWFGRATMQWWALARRPGATRLLAASTPQELSDLLDSFRDEQSRGHGHEQRRQQRRLHGHEQPHQHSLGQGRKQAHEDRKQGHEQGRGPRLAGQLPWPRHGRRPSGAQGQGARGQEAPAQRAQAQRTRTPRTPAQRTPAQRTRTPRTPAQRTPAQRTPAQRTQIQAGQGQAAAAYAAAPDRRAQPGPGTLPSGLAVLPVVRAFPPAAAARVTTRRQAS